MKTATNVISVYNESNMAGTILIADDEAEVIEMLRLYLEKDGFAVVGANDGMSAFGIASSETLDCILLDVMIPELNGFQLVKRIRVKNKAVPIILLTARVSQADKVLGLDIGADDYVTKPFDPLEVCARIKANIRRFRNQNAECPTEYKAGNCTLNTGQCVLYKDGVPVELTSTEYKVLSLFFAAPKRIFTKEQIKNAAWNGIQFVDDNSIMVVLSKLRAKLGEQICIKNIRGLGYRMEIQEDET